MMCSWVSNKADRLKSIISRMLAMQRHFFVALPLKMENHSTSASVMKWSVFISIPKQNHMQAVCLWMSVAKLLWHEVQHAVAKVIKTQKTDSVQYLKGMLQYKTNFVMNSIQMRTQNRSVSWKLGVYSNYLNICVLSE